MDRFLTNGSLVPGPGDSRLNSLEIGTCGTLCLSYVRVQPGDCHTWAAVEMVDMDMSE